MTCLTSVGCSGAIAHDNTNVRRDHPTEYTYPHLRRNLDRLDAVLVLSYKSLGCDLTSWADTMLCKLGIPLVITQRELPLRATAGDLLIQASFLAFQTDL